MSRMPEAVSVALKLQITDELESRLKVPGNASMFPSANTANVLVSNTTARETYNLSGLNLPAPFQPFLPVRRTSMQRQRLFSLFVLAASLAALAPGASAQQKLYVYTSMKESMVGDLKAAFVKKHPDIKIDFQSAGAGKLMAKIAAERESGKILADVLWTSEVPDFYQMKAQGMLLPYVPADSKALLNPLPDYVG